MPFSDRKKELQEKNETVALDKKKGVGEGGNSLIKKPKRHFIPYFSVQSGILEESLSTS